MKPVSIFNLCPIEAARRTDGGRAVADPAGVDRCDVPKMTHRTRVAVADVYTIGSKPRADGSQTVASFTAIVGGIRLAWCVVVKQPDQSLIALPPRAKTRRGGALIVTLVDPDLDSEFQAAALAAYHAISQGEDHAT